MKLKALSEIGFVWHKMPSAIPHGPPQPHRAIPPNPKMICHNPAMRTLSICLLSAATLCAQVDFTALKELKYRNIGPFRGGRAVAVAGEREIPSGVQPIFGRCRSTANGSGFSPPLGCLHCAPNREISRIREANPSAQGGPLRPAHSI